MNRWVQLVPVCTCRRGVGTWSRSLDLLGAVYVGLGAMGVNTLIYAVRETQVLPWAVL